MMDTIRPPTRAAALKALQRAADAQTAAQDDLTAKVMAARLRGAPVDRLATVLGVQQPNVSRDYKLDLSTLDPDERKRMVRLRYHPAPEVEWAGALRAVARAKATRDAARDNMRDNGPAMVAACRQVGVVWREIAAVLGQATPNVITKYRPMLETQTTVTLVAPSKLAAARAKRAR